MSWFGSDEHVGTEIAEGVVVERRRMLKVSAAMAGALVLSGPARAAGRRDAPPLDLEKFLDEVLPLARELVKASAPNEDAYLFQVAARLAQLQDRTANPRAVMQAFRKRHAREDEPRFPLFITQLRLKPGGRLAHHDHRNYNGVIVGVEGEVRIKNFDILGDDPVPPEGRTFQIQETRDDRITPGRFSMLSRRTDNVHDLVAGKEGARVLDVFTFFTKRARSYWMTVDDKPRDPERRIYEAAWKPRRRRRR